jgi:predicted RNA methylase
LRADNAEAGERLASQSGRFLAYKDRHLLGTAPQAVTGFNLFQTPRPVAAMMAKIVLDNVQPGARILEPSAGLGRLVEPFTAPEIEALRLQWEAVEESAECIRAIRKGWKQLHEANHADFLALSAHDLGGQFDAVIMNPPFKQGRDIKHIQHALTMLKPGGRLVSLCYNGTRQNEQLKPIADVWEVLPESSFKSEGTSASVVMIVIDKQ